MTARLILALLIVPVAALFLIAVLIGLIVEEGLRFVAGRIAEDEGRRRVRGEWDGADVAADDHGSDHDPHGAAHPLPLPHAGGVIGIDAGVEAGTGGGASGKSGGITGERADR